MAQPNWNTPVGTLGTYPADIPVVITLSATAVAPASSLTYKLISGSLPAGLAISTTGIISGIPKLSSTDLTNEFTIRVTDNFNNIRDRSFSITVASNIAPSFVTPSGEIFNTWDSIWIQYQIEYDNPIETTKVIVQVREGELPPGLEINEDGLIQGYAKPPVINSQAPTINTIATETNGTTYEITCLSTEGFTIGRPIIFTGSVFGDITASNTYYVKEITSITTFTISTLTDGPVFPVTFDTGIMTTTLPAVSVGQPTIRTYNFTLQLFSLFGTSTSQYAITVINQNSSVLQGGPGKPYNTRIPTILNTRPLTFNVNDSDPYYGYYSLPPISPSEYADIGSYESDNYFSFKVIGYDFDGNFLTYSFANLPSWLTGNSNTGWITGNPNLLSSGISTFSFSVNVAKSTNPTIYSPTFNFQLIVVKDIKGNIEWITSSDLGQLLNGSISNLSVLAISDVELNYRIVSGSLPPNLTLLSNGDISGRVAFQPTSQFKEQGTTENYSVSIEAYSDVYPTVTSTKSFSLSVYQEFSEATDILYIKATPSIEDRVKLRTLLNDTNIFPEDYIYRPYDTYFGKASSVIYEHAFGIYASNIEKYLEAIVRNHYWRNITLGEIKTALAKNDNGEVIYEVVYSEVIDNLVNPEGVSISSEIVWPRVINLGLNDWYVSLTEVYTSYVEILNQQYYTSLTPGSTRNLYPNSLPNMRNRVASVLGQVYNSKLLPLWMTSQQLNGSTLGYVPSWVICYTKPGYADIIANNIKTMWPFTLNQINFGLDRFTVDKSATYDYISNITPPGWSELPSATPTPDPIDSKDFYVLFPRKTILPGRS